MVSQSFGVLKREQIMEFIIGYFKEKGYAPTIREIGDGVGLKSTSSVDAHLRILVGEGKLETDEGKFRPRAFRVVGYEFVKKESGNNG